MALGGLSMERKDFAKEYDGAFDDFRTSGSMPDIPGMGERYSLEASYARARGGPVTVPCTIPLLFRVHCLVYPQVDLLGVRCK